ncbi:predicted protein [Chaetoceros tenuissimus]|uniref:Uncharacterized protein n=1 Tax=Chaetoceros tenuissimus TaxID=426638 RepID=A0AAD3D032_9STRA|nr:predicted protein [Chaetoceros tenuissimus]
MFFEEKPIVLKIHFGADKKGYRWIDRSKRSRNQLLQKCYTEQEWKEFCDNVDSSLNPEKEEPEIVDNEPDFIRTETAYSSQGICSRIGKCLYWTGLFLTCVGCCVLLARACCNATEKYGGANNNVVQPPQVRACINMLKKESEKKGNILLELVASGDAESGAYPTYIKCTIKDHLHSIASV